MGTLNKVRADLEDEKNLGNYYKQRIEKLNEAEEQLKKEMRQLRATNLEYQQDNTKLRYLEKLDTDWDDIEARIQGVEEREAVVVRIQAEADAMQEQNKSVTAQMSQLLIRFKEKESEGKVLHAMTKTQGRQLNDAEETIRDLRRQHADETALLQAELQDVRFEKNSLKEEITNTGEFKKLHETVDKL